MSRFFVGDGRVKATVDNGLENAMRSYLSRLVPRATEELEEEVEGVYRDAFARWPVRTGVSRAGLQRGLIVSPDGLRIRGSVWNDVPYAKFIKALNLGRKSVFVELLRKPIATRTADLVRRLVGLRLGRRG